MNHSEMKKLKLQLALEAKHGIDFMISASIIWSAITFIWTLPYSAYDKSILTFIAGGAMLPLTLLLSKFLKTNWKVKGNPLQPLGLWLNFAQLFYFPFLVFVLLKSPEYFVMTYVIITGAHFFPYAWFYNEKAYAFMAGIISAGALLIALNVSAEQMYYVPLFMTGALLVLVVMLTVSYKKKLKTEKKEKVLQA